MSRSARCARSRSRATSIRVGFTLGSTQIGKDSRAAIRTDTILGRRNIEIEPRGSDLLRANNVLPLGQTTTPYQIYDAFVDLSRRRPRTGTSTPSSSH